jgi:DNA-binding CsgD family transcriptional regulator
MNQISSIFQNFGIEHKLSKALILANSISGTELVNFQVIFDGTQIYLPSNDNYLVLECVKDSYTALTLKGFRSIYYSVESDSQLPPSLSKIIKLNSSNKKLTISIQGFQEDDMSWSLYIIITCSNSNFYDDHDYLNEKIAQIEFLRNQLKTLELELGSFFQRAGDKKKLSANALTQRESEIMDYVKNGKTNIEISLILKISPNTVKNHLKSIFKKLDVVNRAQAVSSNLFSYYPKRL